MRRISAPRIFKHWNRNLLGKGGSGITPPTPVLTSALLKQDGSFLLQQDGGKLLLNQN
jgi:hypothetical protein